MCLTFMKVNRSTRYFTSHEEYIISYLDITVGSQVVKVHIFKDEDEDKIMNGFTHQHSFLFPSC